jgi:hypothetical protein
MGTLSYDSTTTVEINDRELAHLQLVIVAKLRRKESFLFTWENDPTVGGTTSVWMHANANLTLRFEDSGAPLRINRAWVDELALAANSARGLFLTAEPAENTRAR